MMWLPFLPDVLITAALFLVPGIVVLLAGGMRGFFAVAAAPAVSVVLISGSAILASLLGVRWGFVPPVATTLAATAIALGFAWVRGRAPASQLHPFPRSTWPWWAAMAAAALLWARHLRNVLDRPEAFSQTFDNVWHLNAIHHMVATGDASSLTVALLNSSGGGFYPAAFHNVASLTMLANGGELLPATNAVAAVICAVVWPLASLFLVRSAFRPRTATIVATGVLTASFTAFPLLLLDFGVLYANLLGLALLPVGVGVVVQLAGLGQDRWLDWPRGAVIMLALVPALLLSHPNAFMTLLMVSATLMVPVLWRQATSLRRDIRHRGAWVSLALAVAIIGLTFYLWPRLRPGTTVDEWPPPLSSPAAVGHALTNAPLGLLANWVVSALMVYGIVVAFRRSMGWLVAAWAVVVYFWMVISSFPPDEYRLALVGIWYNDSARFAANLPLLALPLAALGVDGLLVWAQARLNKRSATRRLMAGRGAVAVGTVLVVVALAAGTQRTVSMNVAVDRASGLYALRDDSPLVDRDEYRLIERLPDLVPAEAVIANNPWNGSALAYALADRRVTAPHLLYGMTPLREVVRESLDDAATDPRVCPVLEDGGVDYVLDFGSKGVHGPRPYEGLDDLDTAPGFREVAREGDALLYEITACG